MKRRVLDLRPALTWEQEGEAAKVPLESPLAICVHLPPAVDEKVFFPWWPDWLHVHLAVVGGF
jgi:hypothetical protein